jgi:hypothetical protein
LGRAQEADGPLGCADNNVPHLDLTTALGEGGGERRRHAAMQFATAFEMIRSDDAFGIDRVRRDMCHGEPEAAVMASDARWLNRSGVMDRSAVDVTSSPPSP